MNAIILCGGLATRLGEITKTVPKVLVEIGGKTVFERQMKKLQNFGVREVVLAAGHLSEVLYEKIGENWNSVKVVYAIEPERLDTGGAIKYAMNFLSSADPVVVLNGDVLTTVDFSDISTRLKNDMDGIILGSKVEDSSCYGTLVYDEFSLIKEFREKEGRVESGYINGGVYFFNPENIKKYFPEEKKFSMEYHIFPNVKKLYVYESDHPWIDIGVPSRLQWARDNWEIFEE